MKSLLPLIAFMGVSLAASAEPQLPLHSGQYKFQHKFAEHPNMQSIVLTAQITGHRIVLINDTPSEIFPKGVIAEGTLMWHSKSRQWIVGQERSDRHAKEVGSCSDGPEVVDLKRHIYWTC